MRSHENPQLRHCDDIERAQFDQQDEACLNKLAQYEFVQILGSGKYGIVIKVTNENSPQALVVKIVKATWGNVNELKTACAVDRKIARENVIFSRVYQRLSFFCIFYSKEPLWGLLKNHKKTGTDGFPAMDQIYRLHGSWPFLDTRPKSRYDLIC
jgi:hypothetical protein